MCAPSVFYSSHVTFSLWFSFILFVWLLRKCRKIQGIRSLKKSNSCDKNICFWDRMFIIALKVIVRHYTTRSIIREQSWNSSPGEGIWWISHHRQHDTLALRWSSWGRWRVGLIWLFFLVNLHEELWLMGRRLGIRFCFISDIFCYHFWRKK